MGSHIRRMWKSRCGHPKSAAGPSGKIGILPRTRSPLSFYCSEKVSIDPRFYVEKFYCLESHVDIWCLQVDASLSRASNTVYSISEMPNEMFPFHHGYADRRNQNSRCTTTPTLVVPSTFLYSRGPGHLQTQAGRRNEVHKCSK